jgi:hypothetical protein
MKKTVVIGDVHGCYDELMLLLDKLNYSPRDYDVILAGDLVDRGPKSQEVVEWAMSHQDKGVQAVAGNHDEKHFRYYKHVLKRRLNPNYSIPMRPFGFSKLQVFNSLANEELDYLGSLPGYIHLEDRNWVIVHAGLEPHKPLEDQTYGKMTHIRFVDPETLKTASLDDNYEPPPGSIYWTELYNLPYNVVYGHNVHSKTKPQVTVKPNGAQLVGIDTGACFGGRLTAFILPENGEVVSDKHFVQVDAIQTYSDKLLNLE